MAAKESSPAQNTVIGPSILISGKLIGDEDLTVRGRVEGELTLSKTLIVETSGIVKANVVVKNAIVSGVVVGNISATDSVELTKECRMVGDIRSPRVMIVDGASFRGRVEMGEVEPGRAAERAAKAGAGVKTQRGAPPRPPSAPVKGEGKKHLTKPLPPPPPSLTKVARSEAGAGEGKKRLVIKKKAK